MNFRRKPMFYKEIKDLLSQLNNENVQELKPILIRKFNKLILSIDDDINISDSELESIYNVLMVREQFRKDARKEDNSLLEGILINSFIKSYDEFINEIGDKDYVSDAIEITLSSLRSIGGLVRSFRLMKNMKTNKAYINSMEHLNDLKAEFYNHLKLYAHKGFYEEQFVVSGLIHIIKFNLEEESQEHGRFIISMLTDHKTNRMKSLEEFNNEPHIEGISVKLKREYGIELQRRLYLWDNLTRKLEDHYYLEKLYEGMSE
jgi:hypothetical protein